MLNRVGVVGLGTMGAGIVEVFARNGIPVVAVEVDAAALTRGQSTVVSSVDRAVARGRLPGAERDPLLGRVTFAAGLAALSEVDLVVEAVPEYLELKRRIFGELDQVCRPEAILATNTSSLPVTQIAVATGRPERVIGLHFFNPAPVMRLVEVVRTVVTAESVVADVQALCGRLGKVGVTIGDRAGFIANALLFGYLNQAVAMVESGHVSRDDLDTALRLGAGLPLGPLALLDLIGLDTAQSILTTMYRDGGRDRRHAPAPLLRQMVTAGLLGRKAGRGFYPYPAASSEEGGPVPGPAGPRSVGVIGESPSALVELLAKGGHLVTAASLAEADRVADAELIVAAVDSTDPVIGWAMATGRPERVVGLHLVRPIAGGEPAVAEVVTTVRTAPATRSAAESLCRAVGLHPVVCRDRAGFVVDALLHPYLNDAVAMLDAGYASAVDIDHAMTLGCGYPVGPLRQLDALGLPRALAVQQALYRESREPGLAPSPLLAQLAAAGRAVHDPS